jgi:hypothetical protein
MKNLRIAFFWCLLSFLSCSKNEGTVFIFKQWHLSPNQDTTSKELAKKLPQFINQKDIFLKTKALIESHKTDLIIAEGCEGEINEDFSDSFNGWTLKKLKKERNSSDFADIMAPVPMKLKVMFPKLEVLCGDNMRLIEENLRAMSDVRGFYGFYQGMKDSQQTNKERYEAYVKQLVSLYPQEAKNGPMQFALDQTKIALLQFEKFIKKRNEFFFDIIKKQVHKNPVVIIGGLHVEDLTQRLHEKSYDVKEIIPKGYKNDEQLLLLSMKEILNAESIVDVIFYQVPEGFDKDKFLFKNKIKKSELFSNNEWETLKKQFPETLSEQFLFSDYDDDGIRDFTFSRSSRGTVMTAEDTDWDNDGVDNLVDMTLGDTKISKEIPIGQYVNNYFSSKKKEKILKSLSEQKITVLAKEGYPHEILVLEILDNLLKRKEFDGHRMKYIKASSPFFTYGENSFFAYIKHTNSMEYYPQQLSHYVNSEYQKRFKGVKFEDYIQKFIVPLIVHSLAHELAHALEKNYEDLSKQFGWQWKDSAYQGKYLTKYRHREKEIKSHKTNMTFKNKPFQSWKAEYRSYTKTVNKILKSKQRDQLLKTFKYSTGLTELEQSMSFFAYHKIPSLYATLNPAEWYAESFSACVFQRIFKESQQKSRSIELEHLLGFYPLAMTPLNCKTFIDSTSQVTGEVKSN